MHFSSVIVLKKSPRMCKRIPMVEAPNAVSSLTIYILLIIWLVTGRKVMSSRPFLAILDN